MLFVVEEVSHTLLSVSWSHSGLEGSRKGNGSSCEISFSYIPESRFIQETSANIPEMVLLTSLNYTDPKSLGAPDQKRHRHLPAGSGRQSTIFEGVSWEHQKLVLQICYWESPVKLAMWLSGEPMGL